MIPFLAFFHKEFLQFKRNWRTFVFSLMIPVIILLMNYFLSASSVSVIKIGMVTGDASLQSLLQEHLPSSEQLKFEFQSYPDKAEAEKAIEANRIHLYIAHGRTKQIELGFHFPSAGGQMANQYVTSALQQYLSRNLAETRSELFQSVLDAQPFRIVPTNVSYKDRIDDRSAGLLGVGLLWILLYMPLSQASGQIQEEKLRRTLYHLYRAPVSKAVLLLGKMAVAVMAGILSLLFYVIAAKGLGVFPAGWGTSEFGLILLILIHSTVLGYFLGIVLRSGVILATLVLTLPAMLVSGLPKVLPYQFLFELIPTYHSGKLMNEMLLHSRLSTVSISVLLLSSLLFTILSLVALNKIEAIKLCES